MLRYVVNNSRPSCCWSICAMTSIGEVAAIMTSTRVHAINHDARLSATPAPAPASTPATAELTLITTSDSGHPHHHPFWWSLHRVCTVAIGMAISVHAIYTLLHAQLQHYYTGQHAVGFPAYAIHFIDAAHRYSSSSSYPPIITQQHHHDDNDNNDDNDTHHDPALWRIYDATSRDHASHKESHHLSSSS